MENHQLKNDLADARKYIRAQTTDPAMIETIAERLRRAGKYHYAGELYALLLKGGGDVEERKMWNKHLAFCNIKTPTSRHPLSSTRRCIFCGRRMNWIKQNMLTF